MADKQPSVTVTAEDTSASLPNAPTPELQRIVLAGALHDSYFYSLLKDNGVSVRYFTDTKCQAVYGGIERFYASTQKIPENINVLLNEINKGITYGHDNDTILKFITELTLISKSLENNESYLLKCAEEFIIKIRSQEAASKAFARFQDTGELDSKLLVVDMIEALSVSLSPVTVFRMSDLSRLSEIRKEAYGDGIMGTVVPSCIQSINDSFQYQGYQVGTLNMIIAPPGVGKTSFMINEGVHAAMGGCNVLHVYLGDMIAQDSIIRYLACITGSSQKDMAFMSEEVQRSLMESTNSNFGNILDRIGSLCYAAGEITVDKLIEIVKKDQEKTGIHYHFINIDYADNFEKKGENMYMESGYIYERLAYFARLNKSVILVASQPKVQYWSEEIIPMEGAGESSKKAHTADSVICINRAGKGKNFGTIFMAKVRRGTTGNIIRYKSDWGVCRIHEISEREYSSLKAGD